MKVALRLLTMANRFKCAQNGVHVCFKQEENSVWKGSFRFIQAADTQFGLIDQLKYVDWSVDDISIPLAQSKAYRDRGISVWDEEIRLSKLAIEQWNQMIPKPKFVIICGDLVDDFPGCKHRDAQLADFKKTFELLDTSIPLVLLPGNHDLLNCPTPETVDEYRNMFGDDYFVFWVDGVFFIVINVQYYKDRTLTQEYAEIHDKWLDRQLEEAKSRDYKHIIVFQHIPWFIHDVNEPLDEIFNIAYGERIRMLKKFNDYGVRAIFAGHYHRNAGGQFEDMELVVTSAMGAQLADKISINTKSGYRIVEVEEKCLSHRYVEIE